MRRAACLRITAASRSQEGSAQDDARKSEVDHESGHVHERSDKRCRRARGVESQPSQDKRQERACHRPKGHHAKEAAEYLERDEQIVLAVYTGDGVPEWNTQEAEHT